MNNSVCYLRHLFLFPNTCVKPSQIPQSDYEWEYFVYLVHANRLPLSCYHFLSCRNCKKKFPNKIIQKIRTYYFNCKIRIVKREEVINKIKGEAKKNNIKILFLKEFLDYPHNDSPKFDIDIYTQKVYTSKLVRILQKLGYHKVATLKKNSIPGLFQYKFAFKNGEDLKPQIEIRFTILNAPNDESQSFTSNTVCSLVNEGVTAEITKDCVVSCNLTYVILCLIYFYDDCLKGLNNLYRLRAFTQKNKDFLDGKKIDSLLKKYNCTSQVRFISLLESRIFKYPELIHLSMWEKIALRKYSLEFICDIHKNPKNAYVSKSDGYIHFLSRILISQKSASEKIFTLLHPRRFVSLLIYFIFV